MYYLIGFISRTHGIKGEVKVTSLTDFNRFGVGKLVYINEVEYQISSYKEQKNNLIVGFNNINTVEQANLLKGLEIYTKDEPKLNEDEYHLPKLIWIPVYKSDKLLVGHVESLVPQGNGYLLIIKTNDKFVLVPFIKEFVTNVTKDRIDLLEIPGLLEWL